MKDAMNEPGTKRVIAAAKAVSENANGETLAELYTAIMDWPISEYPREVAEIPLPSPFEGTDEHFEHDAL